MSTTSVPGPPAGQEADGWALEVPEVRLGAVNLVLFGTIAGCHLLGVGIAAGLLTTGLVLLGGCVVLPGRYAVGTAVCSWAYLTGFVVHAGGRLSLHHDDLGRLGVLVVLAALTTRRPR